jgi:hypothetical protein
MKIILKQVNNMATTIRARISEKNKYYIDKHRHYELKHFCLQYPQWKRAYIDCLDESVPTVMIKGVKRSDGIYDPEGARAAAKSRYHKRMRLLERIAKEADNQLWYYILKAVTEGLSYTYLRTRLDIPCGRDMYYDRYRRFFWLLSEYRD